MATRTASQDFIQEVIDILESGLEEKKGVRRGINCFSQRCVSAYILAAAAVEAYLNETYLSPTSRYFLPKEAALWHFSDEWLEKLDLSVKVLLIPQLLFGRSLHRDTMPYQDFHLLVKARNELVHFKMDDKVPKFVQPLTDRGILLSQPHAGADFDWVTKLSCTEGVRWAYNTACAMVHELIAFDPKPEHIMYEVGGNNFQPVDENYVRARLIEMGIDPDTNDPPDPPKGPARPSGATPG